MPHRPIAAVLRHARALAGAPAVDATDRLLLAAVAAGRDDAAFAALLDRYGPLVWSVARRLLGHGPDAEDAFQATFLVLARQAGSIRRPDHLAAWLVGVARRVALKARRTATLSDRQTGEQRPEDVPDPGADPADAAVGEELRRLVIEELAELPAKYQQPLILCYLQGRTHRQAAADLGWPNGSLSRRMEKACALLRDRLVRRGVTVSVAAVTAALTGDATATPPLLVAQTLRLVGLVAAGEVLVASPAILRLADGVTVALTAVKLKMGLAAAVALVVMGTGFGLLARPGQPPAGPDTAKKPAVQAAAPARVDQHGDPLPPGVIARLGTIRLRSGQGISHVVFAPDGKSVAGAGGNGSIHIWDVTTGRELRHWEANDRGTGQFGFTGAKRIAFSPDGKKLAATRLNGPLTIWDMATGRELFHKDDGDHQLGWFGFSPDGKLLAYSGAAQLGQRLEFYPIHIADAETGRELRRLNDHVTPIWSAAFTPDISKLVSVPVQVAAHVWDVATGRELRRLEGQGDSIAVSPDGATATVLNRLRKSVDTYDLTTGRRTAFRTLPDVGHDDSFANGAYRLSADGRTAVVAQRPGLLRLVDVASGRESGPIRCDFDILYALAFSPDGRTLAATANNLQDGRLHLLRVPTGEPALAVNGHRGEVIYVTFAPDGRTVVTADRSDTIRQWDATTGREVRRWDGFDALKGVPNSQWIAPTYPKFGPREDAKDFDTVTMSPDGRFVVGRGRGPVVRLWDAATGKILHDLTGHEIGACGMAFSPDSKFLAIGSTNWSVRLWDVAAGHEVWRVNETLQVNELVFSPDGRQLACGGLQNRRVKLLEARTGTPRGQLIGHQGPVGVLAFSHDGGRLASGSADGTALIWDLYVSFRGPAGDPLSPQQIAALWEAMDGPDAAAAFAAMERLARRPDAALALLRDKLRPIVTAPAERTTPLLRDLDSAQFAVREQATRDLTVIEEAAEPALRQALHTQPSPEARGRIERLLEHLESGRTREARAIELLEHLDAAGARKLLEELAGGASGAWRTTEATAALRRLR